MPQYLFGLHDDESWYDHVSPEEWAQEMTRHEAFTRAVTEAGGRILGGEVLERSSLTTVVHNAPDGAVVTDGPFVETKEVLGGFYLVELADLDLAIAMARQCPSAHVEIRPLMEIPQA